jgi:Mg-chelatase subunit ChlI
MAIMGQEELSLALILNQVNPQIGGVLIRGTKGTGKSTAVYGFPQISPSSKSIRIAATTVLPKSLRTGVQPAKSSRCTKPSKKRLRW